MNRHLATVIGILAVIVGFVLWGLGPLAGCDNADSPGQVCLVLGGTLPYLFASLPVLLIGAGFYARYHTGTNGWIYLAAALTICGGCPSGGFLRTR